MKSFLNDSLGESNAMCDLETFFDKADKNGCFNVSDYNLDMILSLEYGINKGYCEAVTYYDFRITDEGKKFLASYKKDMQEFNNLALHSVE